MVSVRKAGEVLSQRDPLFFARGSNFREQCPKPTDCEGCSLQGAPYAFEEAPLFDKNTKRVIPTDVLIIIPRPTLADVGEPPKYTLKKELTAEEREAVRASNRKKYIQPFGALKRGDASPSWWLYRKVLHALKGSLNIRTIYAVPCRGQGQTPVKVAKHCGERYLRNKIRFYAPKAILCLGDLPAKALGVKFSKMVDLRGTISYYEDLQLKVPIVFSYDPELYFFPSQDYKVLERFHCDFAKAVEVSQHGYNPVNHDELKQKLRFPQGDGEICKLIDELMETHKNSPITLAFDLETTGLWHWYDEAHCALLNRRNEIDAEKHPDKLSRPAEIVALSLAWGKDKAAAFLTRDLKEETWKSIKLLLESDIPKIAHNAKFDMSYLLGLKGIRTQNLRADTLLSQHALDENRTGYVHGEYSLKKLVWDYLPEFGGYEQLGDVKTILKSGAGAGDIDTEALLYYAALDSLVTWELYRKQFFLLNDKSPGECRAGEIKTTRLYRFTKKTMTRAAETISDMEVAGLRLDVSNIQAMKATIELLLIREEGNIMNILISLGKPSLNYRSTPQLEELLFDLMGLPVIKNTKKGKRSTDVAVLQELVQHDRTGLVEALTRVRRLQKLKRSFLESWEDIMKGDRVYPFINLDGTKTGRLSMRAPNIQQVPKPDKFEDIAKAYQLPKDYFNLKTLFIPDEGHLLIDADFSQMEVRVLAAYCEEGALQEALSRGAGLDVHSSVASMLTGIDYDLIETARKDKTHPRHSELNKIRSQTKNVTFAITYGGSEHTLHERYGVPLNEGKKLFAEFFERFPEVKRYIESTHREAQRKKYVDTKFHRRRHFPILKYSPRNGRALRQSQNARIQSTASDICLTAVMDLHDMLKSIGGRVLITVHDSIVSQAPKERIVEGLRLYKKAMLEKPLEEYGWLNIPLAIDLEVGTSWGKTKRIALDETTWEEELGPLLK